MLHLSVKNIIHRDNKTMSELRKKYLSALVYIFFVSLFFDIRTGNIGLILLLIGSAFTIKVRKFRSTILENKFTFLLALFFMLHLVGLINTSDISNGWFSIEKKLSFLLAPIVIIPAYRSFNKADFSILFRNLGWLSLFSSLILLVWASFKSLVLKDGHAFFFEEFSPISYVYYSMYFVVTVSFSIYDLLRDESKKKIVPFILIVYSLFFLVVVSSKMGIISFVVCSSFSLILTTPIKHYWALFIAMIFCLTLFISLHSTTRSRFIVLIENLAVIKANTVTDYQNFTGLNLRLLFWKFSVQEVIDRNAVFMGAGTGDAQHLINDAYKRHGLDEYGYIGFDPHNQWVFTFAQFGLVGVLTLLLLYVKTTQLALKKKDWLMGVFLITTFFYSLTESILESNKGIIFFAVISVLLILSNANAVSLVDRTKDDSALDG